MNDAAPASTIQSSAGGFSGREIAIGEIRSPRSVINGVYQLPNFKELNMLLPHGTVLAVIEGLNGQVQGGKIAHLVVIAPPKALGELRRHYGSHLEGALLKEIAKDLAGRSGKDVLETVQAA